MTGARLPKGTSALRSSYSRVSAEVVMRMSRSVDPAAAPSARANTREPAAGAPSVKKSTSPAGEIDPSVPQAGLFAAAGEELGSLSRRQRVASTLKGPAEATVLVRSTKR